MSHKQKNLLFISISVVIPMLFWMFYTPLFPRFQDGITTLTSIGQITGIIGMMLFSLSFLYSARFKWIERLLGPLNELYLIHHLLGTFAFIALLIHPIIIILSRYLSHDPDILFYIIPGLFASYTWGILSLWLLIILLVLTLYIRPKYGLWKRSHQLLGITFFLGGLHGFYITSDISRNSLLRWYVLGFALLSFILFVFHTVLKKFTKEIFLYRIKTYTRLSDAVVSIHLTPMGKKVLSAKSGQFIFIKFHLPDKWSESHPFSISHIDPSGNLSISFKALGDETEVFVKTLTEGIEARIDGPFGTFGDITNHSQNNIYVAGGIGVTPFLALLECLPDNIQIDLFYTTRSKIEAVHIQALEEIANNNKNINLHYWFSQDQGYLTADAIKKIVPIQGQSIFLCGPPSMMNNLRAQFVQQGVPDETIYSEEFSL